MKDRWLFRGITHDALFIHDTPVSRHVQPQTTIAVIEM